MMARRPSLASSRRGFTLVELLVAMTAGLMVSMAAFLLSKNATRFFQNEARVSAAHLAATLGINRISADLQRAGLLSSANVLQDPFVCGKSPIVLTWPDGMRRLAGIEIERNGSELAHPGAELSQSTVGNGLHPDALIIGGSMNTLEQFYFNTISCGPGGCAVNLDPLSGAVKRTLLRQQGEDPLVVLRDDIFRAGRFLRIQMLGQAESMYSIIQGITVVGDPPTTITIQLEATPNLPTVVANGCGLPAGFGAGYVNPVSRIRYDIRSVRTDPNYGPLVAPISPEATGDDLRTELVRVELGADNLEDPTTLELVAEYAVDLKFGITRATEDPDPLITNPTLIRHRISDPVDANVYSFAAGNANAGSAPQRIRAVQVRLATRTRAPDRDVGLPLPGGLDGRRLRFLIPGIIPGVLSDGDTVPPDSPPVYARMRTLYAEVALQNQARIKW